MHVDNGRAGSYARRMCDRRVQGGSHVSCQAPARHDCRGTLCADASRLPGSSMPHLCWPRAAEQLLLHLERVPQRVGRCVERQDKSVALCGMACSGTTASEHKSTAEAGRVACSGPLDALPVSTPAHKTQITKKPQERFQFPLPWLSKAGTTSLNHTTCGSVCVEELVSVSERALVAVGGTKPWPGQVGLLIGNAENGDRASVYGKRLL